LQRLLAQLKKSESLASSCLVTTTKTIHSEAAPTTSLTTYLVGGTKAALDMLNAVSSLVPLPWFGAAVGAASQVIKVAEVSSKSKSVEM
jgi:hypothetical protein